MHPILRACHLVTFAWLALLAGCASLGDYDQPTVDVIGIQPETREGQQGFVIRLRITNPNATALAFDGISYRLSVAGHDLVTGVANDLPEIAGYGQADVSLSAVPSVLGGLALLAELMSRPVDALDYRLSIKLDPAGRIGAFRIEREGKIDLRPERRAGNGVNTAVTTR